MRGVSRVMGHSRWFLPLRHAAGQCVLHDYHDRMDLRAAATDFADSTRVFLEAARAVRHADLDSRQLGDWSVRQIIHHVADSEAQSYARLRRLVAEPEGCLIQGYDEAAWAACPTLGYDDLPVDNSLLVIQAVRAASLDIIQRLTVADLDRMGTHSESGAYSVRDWLRNYTAHPRDHAAQLAQALAAGTSQPS